VVRRGVFRPVAIALSCPYLAFRRKALPRTAVDTGPVVPFLMFCADFWGRGTAPVPRDRTRERDLAKVGTSRSPLPFVSSTVDQSFSLLCLAAAPGSWSQQFQMLIGSVLR
jgi:hypothetical protein